MVSAETAKRLLQELYGYDLSDADARIVANGVGALHAGSRQIAALEIAGVEAPVSFTQLLAEAERLNSPRK